REERRPITNHPQAGLGVGLQLTSIALKLFPADIRGVPLVEQDLTGFGLGHTAPCRWPTRLSALWRCWASPIAIRARVDGMVRQMVEGVRVGPRPDQFPRGGGRHHAMGQVNLMLD